MNDSWLVSAVLVLTLGVVVLAGFFFIAGFFRSPFIPSSKKTLAVMLAAAKLKKGARVVDLGSGDGRILFAAERAGARATGYEISVLLWLFSQLKKYLLRSRVIIHRRSFYDADLRSADVVFCYLLPEVMQRLAPKLHEELPAGARVISASFSLPGFHLQEKIAANDGAKTVFVYEKR